jgi:hypothetical protein
VDPSAFLDRANPPDDDAVQAALGPAAPLWDALKAALAHEFDPIDERWAFSGKAHGWSLSLRRSDRPIVYLTPLAGRFRASLALPERAVAAALQADLPERIRAAVASAPTYPEGRAVRLEVATEEDLQAVLALARIRMAS